MILTLESRGTNLSENEPQPELILIKNSTINALISIIQSHGMHIDLSYFQGFEGFLSQF